MYSHKFETNKMQSSRNVYIRLVLLFLATSWAVTVVAPKGKIEKKIFINILEFLLKTHLRAIFIMCY